ncbi:MAG: hypothetical protein LBS07_03520, partial [Prevotellaceae bacterium]|jgi:hypothetical protein|nr:hypothetical protein [Prevotellaceae bacterium]
LFHKNTVAPADFHLEESGAFHQPKASNAADYSSSFSSSPLIFSGVAPKGASAAPERHGFMAVNSAYNPKIGLLVQLSAGDGVDPDNGNEEDMGSPLAVGSCLWILLFFILFYSAVKQLRLSRF